ncbi:MAG: right-handed parallel beta-helix repeat-containing protein, partial [Candidatus Nanoarchaeia archaeon]|nr:right-handed parallel beta-helix repeat-containing protein [Candidatus Nanoarchaeia archaeon]
HPAFSTKATIGTKMTGSTAFDGSIDEVLVFNRTLSANEISALYDSSTTQYGNNFTNLAEGNHSFKGYSVDIAGNKNDTGTRSVTIDGTAPNVTINVPANTTYGWNNVSMDFNVTLNENGSVMFSLDGGATNHTMDSTDNQNFNYTNSSMIDGSYTFQVYANDTEGNTNYSESVVFTVNNSLVYDCGALSEAGRTYYLQNDVSTTSDCFTITADSITFDGEDYNVDGDDSDTGIEMIGRFNVTLKNLNITDFFYGIKLTLTNESTILLNNISSGTDGILVEGSLRNKIQNNTLTDNSQSGIHLDVTGSVTSNNNAFEYNLMKFGGYGIILKNGAGNNTFYKDEIDSTSWEGINIFTGYGNEFNDTIINNSLKSALHFIIADDNIFNNLTIENTSLSYYDVKFQSSNSDGNKFVNTPLANYSIGGAGNKLIFKETGLGEIEFLEVINGTGTNLSSDI